MNIEDLDDQGIKITAKEIHAHGWKYLKTASGSNFYKKPHGKQILTHNPRYNMATRYNDIEEADFDSWAQSTLRPGGGGGLFEIEEEQASEISKGMSMGKAKASDLRKTLFPKDEGTSSAKNIGEKKVC